MNTTMFNDSAAAFAQSIDTLIAQDRYQRGKLFLDAVQTHVPDGAEILDYGCGPGRISCLLAREKYRVTGFDASPGMLREATKLARPGLDLQFRLDPNEGRDLETAKFDAIVCSSVIEYVVDPKQLLRRFHNGLRPGGHLVISYSNKSSLWRKYARMRYGKSLEFYRYQHNIWSFGEFKKILAAEGFETLTQPQFFEAGPFDKRPALNFLTASPLVGILGLVVARQQDSTNRV